MKNILKTGLLAAAMLGAAEANAARTVVDFEAESWSDGYGGISGWGDVGQWSTYSPAELRDPALGDYRLHAWGGELRFDQAPVVFEGMSYVSWAGSDSNVSFSLYYQGELVHSEPLDIVNQPINIYWLASGYSGLVDKILLHSQGSDGFLVDNLTYSTAAPVPLPGAVWLFGSALAGLMLRSRRGRNG